MVANYDVVYSGANAPTGTQVINCYSNRMPRMAILTLNVHCGSLRAVLKMRLRLQFISQNSWVVWDLLLLL